MEYFHAENTANKQLEQTTTSVWCLEMAMTITVNCFLIGSCDIITETVIVAV